MLNSEKSCPIDNPAEEQGIKGDDIIFSEFLSGAKEEVLQKKDIIQRLPADIGDENAGDIEIYKQIDKNLYGIRVNNMRMQFAWCAVILAFVWIFVIIFIVLSHAVGKLYVYPLQAVAWSLWTLIVTAVIVYGAMMGTYIYTKKAIWREALPLVTLVMCAFTATFAFHYVASDVEHGVLPFQRLSDSVLITLISSTTVSVLGILGSVMFWLFPKNKD